MGSGRNKLRAGLQGVDKSGAGRGEIESPGALRAQLVLYQARGRRKEHVGRHRGDDDDFYIRSGEAALRQSVSCRLSRQIAGSHSLVHDVTLTDTGARHDPLVGSFHHLFEVGVGEHARRDVCTEGANLHSLGSDSLGGVSLGGADELAHSIGCSPF